MTKANGRTISRHSIHEVMSRTGSFPLSTATSLLLKYAREPSVVLDCFCGKGTTILAARILGHRAFGLDVAPEAEVCASAKLATISIDRFRGYLSGIRLGNPSLDMVPNEVRVFFADETLKQILSLRNRFLCDRDNENKIVRGNATFGLACLLGILHGHAKFSLSIPSNHAFSMSANYVRRYAAEHGLVAPVQNVKDCLDQKAVRVLKDQLPSAVKGAVRRGCATEASNVFPCLVGKVDVVLTSPPYLNAQTYAKDNWLRHWLLGFDRKAIQSLYIETGSVSLYKERMKAVLKEISLMLRPDGILICIAGDVRLRGRSSHESNVFCTGSELAKIAHKDVGFEIEKRGGHAVKSSSRYFHSLSDSNGHAKRGLVERYFIARKPI
jgi:DNA modification methylase